MSRVAIQGTAFGFVLRESNARRMQPLVAHTDRFQSAFSAEIVGGTPMRIFKSKAAKTYESPKLNKSAGDIRKSLGASLAPSFAPYEILGESINPAVSDSPGVLQGTFLQITNIDPDNANFIVLVYGSAESFVASSGNVALGANYIDGTGNIFDFTEDFLAAQLFSVQIPPLQTFIVGLQYYFDPPSAAVGTPVPAGQESMGNRGYVVVLPFQGAGFLVTATIRQAFVSSLTTTTPKIISSSAYSVPLSNGPLVQSTNGTEELLA